MHSSFNVLAALLVLAAILGFVSHRFLKLPRTLGILVLALAISLFLIGVDALLPWLSIHALAAPTG